MTFGLQCDEPASIAHLDAIEGSLRRLRTDYGDLYQIHHPDAETPMDETLGALDDVLAAADKGLAADLKARLDEMTRKYRYGDDPR